MAQQTGRTFEDMQQRLEQIVDEVAAEDISLDDALALYEEAVKLGLAACDLSETDVEAYLAASSAHEEEAGEVSAEGEDAQSADADAANAAPAAATEGQAAGAANAADTAPAAASAGTEGQ